MAAAVAADPNTHITNRTAPPPASLQGSTSASALAPPSSAFSFSAPYPPGSSLGPGLGPKQRRVSLALPAASPRVADAWSFRDDTGLQAHGRAGEGSAGGPLPEKKGKMRRIDSVEGKYCEPDHRLSPGLGGRTLEKKTRKKWSMEETEMLVAGCNKVIPFSVSNVLLLMPYPAWSWELESNVERRRAQV
jgi:hypothetical protein